MVNFMLRMPSDWVLTEGQEIQIEPDGTCDNCYQITCNDQVFPGMLCVLPTHVEHHVTLEPDMFEKRNDVSHVLIVFRTQKERTDHTQRSALTTAIMRHDTKTPPVVAPPTPQEVKRVQGIIEANETCFESRDFVESSEWILPHLNEGIQLQVNPELDQIWVGKHASLLRDSPQVFTESPVHLLSHIIR